MAEFNMSKLLNNKSKSKALTAGEYKVDMLNIKSLVPSEMNFYSTADIEGLMTDISLVGKIESPIVVRPIAGTAEYEIISGHRRHKALLELYKDDGIKYRLVPCIIENLDDNMAKLRMIQANATTRVLTDYEKTRQVAELKAAINALRESGEEISGRTRSIMAQILGESSAQIGRREQISKNLIPEFEEEFKAGNINVSAAYELARQQPDKQEEILNQHKAGEKATSATVKERAKEKPTRAYKNLLKTNAVNFNAIKTGQKHFEIVRLDRDYSTGDFLKLWEYDYEAQINTGANIDVEITYIQKGSSDIPLKEGYAVLSVRRV